MKKLIVLSVLFMITGFAWADDKAEPDPCYVQSAEVGKPSFIVYFGFDSAEIKNIDCLNRLKNNLKDAINPDMCQTFSLIGSADGIGDYQYNADLSAKRVSYINNILKDIFKSSKDIENKFDFSNTGRNDAKPDAMDPKKRFVKINVISKNSCSIVNPDDNKGQKDSREKITKLYADLLAVEKANLGKSVWTDKEGNFNKSRLISDSVAGVVLGTAGGLITSSIIKKNQTENGFEDISCTVGGQVVAGWDDEFTVGIK